MTYDCSAFEYFKVALFISDFIIIIMGYTQGINLMNSKPNPNLNPLMLTVSLVCSLIPSNETHKPCKLQLFASKSI